MEDVDASVGEEEGARSFVYRIPERPSAAEDEDTADAPEEDPVVSEDEESRDDGTVEADVDESVEDGHEDPEDPEDESDFSDDFSDDFGG